MLEDFIEGNSLKAKILNHKNNSNLIKCRIFLADEEVVLVVAAANCRLDLEKIKNGLNCTELVAPDENSVFEVSGYEKQFLPPVSIYVSKALIDEELLGMGLLHCSISETSSLEITAEEIIANNETVITGKYSR